MERTKPEKGIKRYGKRKKFYTREYPAVLASVCASGAAGAVPAGHVWGGGPFDRWKIRCFGRCFGGFYRVADHDDIDLSGQQLRDGNDDPFGAADRPREAFAQTVAYVRICGGGMVVIVAYNLIGCAFRGIGDSRTPLLTVAIACVCNIAGDLILCAGFNMGTKGAAIATVLAQVISVIVSLLFIRRKKLPFDMKRSDLRVHVPSMAHMAKLGAPIALQDMLVSISFLIILAIVNAMGVVASAGVGVAEKVCAFIMLISSAFMQSISAFVAQNYGAGLMDRAKRALHYGAIVSFVIGVGMFCLTFFHGDILAAVFSPDPEVIAAAADYLKAYAIDCLFTAIFFCYTGFYNGIGRTTFVMAQGIIGALGVRVPISYLMSLRPNATLFQIGLATPASSLVQLALCLGYMLWLKRKEKAG